MKTNTNTALLILLSLALSNCTPVPKTELHNLPSLIEIVMLDLSSEQLKVRLSHRNRLTRENNQLSCQLAIKERQAIEFNGIPIPDLTTYAVETIDISLINKNLPKAGEKYKQLPYVLDCFLFSENFRKEHVIKKSILYPVPGTKHEYR